MVAFLFFLAGAGSSSESLDSSAGDRLLTLRGVPNPVARVLGLACRSGVAGRLSCLIGLGARDNWSQNKSSAVGAVGGGSGVVDGVYVGGGI